MVRGWLDGERVGPALQQVDEDGDLGGVFNAPGNATGLQIPTDDSGAVPQSSEQQATPQGGDILSSILGQILGR